jgi:hypothetical protein
MRSKEEVRRALAKAAVPNTLINADGYTTPEARVLADYIADLVWLLRRYQAGHDHAVLGSKCYCGDCEFADAALAKLPPGPRGGP